MNKDIKKLNKKVWYRFLKAAYAFFYIISLLIVIFIAYSNKPYSYWSAYSDTYYSHGSWGEVFSSGIIGLLIVFIIFTLIKKTFHYIAVGEKIIQKSDFNFIKNFTDKIHNHLWTKSKPKKSKKTHIQTVKEQYDTIGGWLILPLIGLFISPFLLLNGIVESMSTVYSENWPLLTSLNSNFYIPYFFELVSYEIFTAIILLFYTIVVLIVFLKKLKITPLLFIILLWVIVIFSWIDAILFDSVMANVNYDLSDVISAEEFMEAFVRSFIFAIVWTLYFLLSKRVKSTFIK